MKWGKSKIGPWSEIKKHNSIDSIRYFEIDSIERGGWHFSYFGDESFIRNKIENFSHQEYNFEIYKSLTHISECISKKVNLFNGGEIEHIEINKNEYLPINYKLLV
jgi:hypothetical protein